jgi:hypothetical protein
MLFFVCLAGYLPTGKDLEAKNAAILGGFDNACNLTDTLLLLVFIAPHTVSKSVEENKLLQEKKLAFSRVIGNSYL